MEYRKKIQYISFFMEDNDNPHCHCGVLVDGTLYHDEWGNVHQGDDWATGDYVWCDSEWHKMSPEEQQRLLDINNVYGTSGFSY